MSVKVFQYGNFEGVVDFTDFRVLEKYEKDMGEYQRMVTVATGDEKSYAAKIHGLFDAVVFIFDSTFGEGASNQILGESTSLNEAIQAFNALVEYRQAQDNESTASWKQIADKYSPKNRQQRRAGK